MNIHTKGVYIAKEPLEQRRSPLQLLRVGVPAPGAPLFHPPDGLRRPPSQPTAERMTVVPNQELRRAPLDFEGAKCRLRAASPRVPAQTGLAATAPLRAHTKPAPRGCRAPPLVNRKSGADPSDSALSAYKATVGMYFKDSLTCARTRR